MPFSHRMFLSLQTRHWWKRWIFKDLELQRWSMPEDIKERHGFLFFFFFYSLRKFETLNYLIIEKLL